jgi:hypothetical protein
MKVYNLRKIPTSEVMMDFSSAIKCKHLTRLSEWGKVLVGFDAICDLRLFPVSSERKIQQGSLCLSRPGKIGGASGTMSI